jgi:hypothetical protein
MADDDPRAIAELIRDLAYRQLDNQFQSSDAYDAKSVGVLGFDGAAIAAILAAQGVFHGWWWGPAALIIASAVLAVMSLWSRRFDDGPDAAAFYERVRTETATVANVTLISDINAAVQTNLKVLKNKSRYFRLALGTAVTAGGLSAILVGVLR